MASVAETRATLPGRMLLASAIFDDQAQLPWRLRKSTNNKTVDEGRQTNFWSGWRDSNPRPLRPERSALPS